MSQNIGEKQKNYLFFEAYLKTFASVLPTASQTPPKDTHCTPFLWALQISHFWFWGVWVGSHNCFNTISERSLHSFLQWPCKNSSLSLNFSDIYGQAPDGNIELRYSHALLLVTASTPPWKCCHNTEADCRAHAAEKNSPFVPGYFPGSSDASASSQHGPTDNSSASWEGDRGSSQDQPTGGNCLGSLWENELGSVGRSTPCKASILALLTAPRSLRQCHGLPAQPCQSHGKAKQF